MKDNATLMFTRSIQTLLGEGVRVCLRDPSMALFIQHMIVRQKRAERVRAHWAQQGVRVPPFMIASVTHRCNLQCKGCYARAQHREAEQALIANFLPFDRVIQISHQKYAAQRQTDACSARNTQHQYFSPACRASWHPRRFDNRQLIHRIADVGLQQ